MGGPTMRRYRRFSPGDPAPLFMQRSTGSPRFSFCTAVGRYVLLCFFVTASDPPGQVALNAIRRNRRLFDDVKLSMFGVSLDPEDESRARVRAELPGIRHVLDFDGAVSRQFGAIPVDAMPGDGDFSARRFWLLLDPLLRVISLVPFAGDGSEQAEVFAALENLPYGHASTPDCIGLAGAKKALPFGHGDKLAINPAPLKLSKRQ